MAHTLLLAFKDSPSAGVDDYIDLGQQSGSGTSATGFGLLGYSLGDPYLDGIGRSVRNITITGEVKSTSNDNVIALLRQISRYLVQTRLYFDRFGGSPPSRADQAHHTGQAAVLTFKPQSATKTLYWNVVDGSAKLTDPNMLGPDIINNTFQVAITLVVEAAARGARVYLNNLTAGGDFAPPFAIDSTNFPDFDAGWVFTGTWTVSTSNGVHSLYSITTSSGGGTATSNEADDITTGDVILPMVWLKNTVTSGTCTAKLQIYNGAAWSDQQTVASVSATTTQQTQYTGAAYTVAAGITKVRLLVTNAATGQVWLASAAKWKNPTGSAVPVEYLAGGRVTGMPSLNVYNVQGDIAAPCKLRLENRSGSNGTRVFMVGYTPHDPAVDQPLFAMDFWTGALTDTLNSTQFWGHLKPTDSTALSSTLYRIYASTSRTVDFRPRIYRAFLVYAANDTTAITRVDVQVNQEIKIFNITLPQTYTGTGSAAAADFRLYDLGDFLYGRPGVAWENATAAVDTTSTSLSVYHSSSANQRNAFAGLILLPAERFFTVDLTGSPVSLAVEVSNEGAAPRVSVPAATTTPFYRELTSFSTGATFTGGNFILKPNLTGGGTAAAPKYTANRFEVLVTKGRDSSDPRMYTLDASYPVLPAVEYSPRYIYGVA